jgi:segregation and condensation protein B
MSLKAKLEAVIYAAEEPVTLAQLTALFAADALEWQAQQAASAREASEEAAAEPLPLINAGGSELDPVMAIEEMVIEAEVVEAELEAEPTPQANDQPVEANADSASEPEAGPDDESATEPAPGEEAEARRLDRLRDREARAVLRKMLDELVAEYAADSRGIEIREIAGGFRVATKPEYHDAVRSFVKSLKPPLRLSLPALETLAVVAYKQPVTAPEVNEIRGVDSSGVFGSLLARKLIATAGRKQVIGRPILYKTTREFLLRFGLKDVTELPSMEEFEKMAAIELEEPEFAQQADSTESAEPQPDTNPALEFDQNGGEPPIDQPDSSAVPESAEMPAVTAVSPDPAQ